MALVPDSTSLSLGVNSVLAKASRAITSFLSPQPHSAEFSLMNAPLARRSACAAGAMDGAAIDVGVASAAIDIGMKRAKLVTAASHPDLMRAWSAMSHRAGLSIAPQTDHRRKRHAERAHRFTAGSGHHHGACYKILDLRETCAVLGHELGHATSDHVKPRVMWMGALGTLGGVAGNEIARRGGTNSILHRIGSKLPFVETLRGLYYPKAYVNKASSMVGYGGFMAAGIGPWRRSWRVTSACARPRERCRCQRLRPSAATRWRWRRRCSSCRPIRRAPVSRTT